MGRPADWLALCLPSMTASPRLLLLFAAPCHQTIALVQQEKIAEAQALLETDEPADLFCNGNLMFVEKVGRSLSG